MTPMRIILQGDGAFPECNPEAFGTVSAMARLPGGMASGAASITVELTLPDGTKAYGQTSLALLEAAARAFRASEEAIAAATAQTH